MLEYQQVTNYSPPALAVAPFGDAMAMWIRNDGTVWSSRYKAMPGIVAPIAQPGTSSMVTELDLVTLQGTGLAAPGSSISSYAWVQTAGPAVVVNAASTANPSFIAPSVNAPTTLTFKLVVTDSQQRIGQAFVSIVVRNSTALTLTPDASKVSIGQYVVVGAALTGSPSPGGKIVLLEGGNTIATATLNNGAVTFYLASVPLGTHSYSAIYAGDATYGPATSNTVVVTVDDLPRVNLSSPADGAQYASSATVPVSGLAYGINGALLRRIDLFDNGVLVNTKALAAPGPNSLSFQFNVVAPPAGQHAYSVTATDDRGMTGDPAVRHVTVVGTATVAITSPADQGFLIAPGFLSLQATASTQNGSITQVEYFANGSSLGVATVAPYHVTWSDVPVGNYSLLARATDSAGAMAESAPVALVVGLAPSLAVTNLASGATIADNVISTLTGTVQAPPNSAVTVNGVLATVSSDGTFVVNNVALQAGSNTLEILVTTAEGATVTQSLTVESVGEAAFEFSADPASGIAPLTSQLQLVNRTGASFTRVDYQCSANGNVTSSTVIVPINCQYTQPGVYEATVSVFDQVSGQSEQVIYTATQTIVVNDVQMEKATLQQVYYGMLNRLRVGNIQGALSAVTGGVASKYAAVFSNLTNLPTVIDQLGVIERVTISRDIAEFQIVRQTPSGSASFLIYLIRAGDGIWRIDGM